MTTAINTLLAKAPHGLQDLHDVLGFDFCAPYDAWVIRGKWTINNVVRGAKRLGYDDSDSVIAVCVRDRSSSWDSDFHLATISDGKFQIDYRPKYTRGGLDVHYAKASYDDVRKKTSAETVIFVQKKADLKMPHEHTFNPYGRYRLEDFDYAYSSKSNMKYINRISCTEMYASGQHFRHELSRWSYYASQSAPLSIDQVIDHSGYILIQRRSDLQQRARKLKAERAKAAFCATDNSAKIAELDELIQKRKAELAKAIASADTYDELVLVYDSLSKYSGFIGAVYDFERLKENDDKKAYSSIANFERDYNRIRDAVICKEE